MLLFAILAPLVGFFLLFLLGKNLSFIQQGYLACCSVFFSFLAFCYLFFNFSLTKTPINYNLFTWLELRGLSVSFGFLLDNLSFVMVLIITGIGLLIHFYSIGYMKNEESSYRYFSFLNLFIFFMLLLVIANNLVLLFLGWEGVGLCSYLLIGFYLEKKTASKAAKKAFIVNRIGDFCFVIALMLIFFMFGSFDFWTIQTEFNKTTFEQELILLTTLMLFLSATGKSAQIPLHIWLPDAMEGPTPVSALIHAATMVTAGIYLIARLHFLFIAAETTLFIMLILGSLTALLGAAVAIVQTDLKKILAYSTISQLGYMFMALGVGAFSTAIFHLLTHAFFKALLFLSAGALIYALYHEQDIRNMGKLKSKMPLIWSAFAVGSWCLTGLPLAAGFFSKDEILFSVFLGSMRFPLFFVIGIFTSLLSAIYTYRMMNLVFYSNERKTHKIKKIPKTMQAVLQILILGSVSVGFLGVPHFLEKIHLQNIFAHYFHSFFTEKVLPTTDVAFLSANLSPLMKEVFVLGLSVFVSGLGMLWMYYKYCHKNWKVAKRTNYIHYILQKKFFIEELYYGIIILPLKTISQNIFLRWGEQKFMRWNLQIFSQSALFVGSLLSSWHNGKLFRYTLTMLFGIVAIVYFFIF